ncbi:carboxy-S-adenosyl-L-methionine synthase CmoA, partial [Alishewanella sp. SMS9]|nr:carboxy-S-adenosyl-L-methionine synthase CmoA [Alishewanella sp. SMS9]
SLSMRRHITADNCKVIAVDNSSAMIERCQRHLQAFRSDVPVDAILGDIRQLTIENAAVVVVNFTMQFLAPEDRQALLNKIYQGLKPGGLLIISEKFKADTPVNDELLIDLYHDFKRANGYSELEISQKRTALEKVMRPDTLATHSARLQQAGFHSHSVWFQCFNFCSMFALKD